MGLDLYSKIEPFLDFQDEIYTLHKEFMRFIMENDIDNIIDIGCGQGYFLENLRINGKNSFGIDLSAEQIKVCQSKGLNAKAIALESVNDKFDCATAIFDVLNYIPKKSLKKFIKDVYLVLNQGSYFIFDVNSFFGFDEIAQGSMMIDLEDKFIGIDANFENNKLYTDIVFFQKDVNGLFIKESDTIIQEYHTLESLSKLLKECGFSIQKIKEFNLHTQDEADKLIFICKKN